MFNSVQYVRELCQQRKIPISQLEKDCGFSNGYLNPKKMSAIPYYRAKVIADYLGISVSSILNDEETEKAPVDSDKRIPDGYNVIKIAGRDGSYRERILTDQQIAAFMAMLDQMPDVPDDL